MRKIITGFIAGALLTAGAVADAVFNGGAISTESNWTGGFPVNGTMGWIGVDATIQSTSRFVGWTVTQTNGNATIGGNNVSLNGNAVWYLQGGLLSSGSRDITIGYTDDPISNATINISGGTLNAGRALSVQYQSLLEQTGGNITADSMKIYSGSKVNVGGGTATITNNLSISGNSGTSTADGSRLTLSGGSWTIDGTLEFHTNLRGSGLVFAEGDASLTANNLTFNSGYIDFVTGSDGSLTVTSFTDAADFDGFINAGQIRIDGKIKTASDFNIVGNTIMIPEPAALSMFLISGLALITYRRMR